MYEMGKLSLRVFDLTEEVEMVRREAQFAGSEVEKH